MPAEEARQNAAVPGFQDHEPRSLAKVAPHVGEVRRLLGEVMVRRRHEQEIDRLRNVESVTCHSDRSQGRDPSLLGSRHQLVERALAGVDAVDDAVRLDGPCHAKGEMAVSRPEIRDHHAGPQLEPLDDGARIAQSILTRASGVQPPPNRLGQTIEDQRPSFNGWPSPMRMPSGPRR